MTIDEANKILTEKVLCFERECAGPKEPNQTCQHSYFTAHDNPIPDIHTNEFLIAKIEDQIIRRDDIYSVQSLYEPDTNKYTVQILVSTDSDLDSDIIKESTTINKAKVLAFAEFADQVM